MKTLLLSLCIVISTSLFGQPEPYTGIGFGFVIHTFEEMDYQGVKSKVQNFFPGLTLSMRLNIWEMSNDWSLSGNAKPTFWIVSYGEKGNPGFGINMEVPLFLSLNFLGSATRISEHKVGGFVGTGYTYYGYTSEKDQAAVNYYGLGPTALAGFQTAHNYFFLGVWASYTRDLSNRYDNSHVFSFGTIYYFGKY